jgi:hypothetical protein
VVVRPDREAGRKFTTLLDWLDSATSEAVVGLENITEYQSGERGVVFYYHCDLEHCKDDQGDAEQMKIHLFTARHRRAWLYKKTGSYLEHQNEISPRIAEDTKELRRDYSLIREVVDRSQWRQARDGRIVMERRRARKREHSYKEEGQSERRCYGRRESREEERGQERSWRSGGRENRVTEKKTGAGVRGKKRGEKRRGGEEDWRKTGVEDRRDTGVDEGIKTEVKAEKMTGSGGVECDLQSDGVLGEATTDGSLEVYSVFRPSVATRIQAKRIETVSISSEDEEATSGTYFPIKRKPTFLESRRKKLKRSSSPDNLVFRKRKDHVQCGFCYSDALDIEELRLHWSSSWSLTSVVFLGQGTVIVIKPPPHKMNNFILIQKKMKTKKELKCGFCYLSAPITGPYIADWGGLSTPPDWGGWG